MTGSAFSNFLDEARADAAQELEEAERYIEWEERIVRQEELAIFRKRQKGHQARVDQIIKFCQVIITFFKG